MTGACTRYPKLTGAAAPFAPILTRAPIHDFQALLIMYTLRYLSHLIAFVSLNMLQNWILLKLEDNPYLPSNYLFRYSAAFNKGIHDFSNTMYSHCFKPSDYKKKEKKEKIIPIFNLITFLGTLLPSI